jgi:hypothetical protein
LLQTAYLLPLTVFTLMLAVAALGYRASRRRGCGPFVLGLAAAVGLVIGRFVVYSDPAVYGSVAVLIAASFWNSWPRAGAPSAPTERLVQLGGIEEDK